MSRVSHPAWVCGLKPEEFTKRGAEPPVTPCVGVWIETEVAQTYNPRFQRSHPAWVCGLKLHLVDSIGKKVKSHPAWVCGLKLGHSNGKIIIYQWSHPAWVCGLKLCSAPFLPTRQKSHPAWVCGLKHAYQAVAERGMKSHPAWVCGLKPDVVDEPFLASKVTPCVGVWIETFFRTRL